jgi:hypothetical protein
VRVREITLGGGGWRQAKGTCDLPEGHSTEQENIRDIVGERRQQKEIGNSKRIFTSALMSVCLSVCLFVCFNLLRCLEH